jgi:hypothetical protein
MAIETKYTLFDFAEKQMFEEVKRKVLDDLVAEVIAEVRSRIAGMLAEYASSNITHMSNHTEMKEEFLIWIKHNDGEQVQK